MPLTTYRLTPLSLSSATVQNCLQAVGLQLGVVSGLQISSLILLSPAIPLAKTLLFIFVFVTPALTPNICHSVNAW